MTPLSVAVDQLLTKAVPVTETEILSVVEAAGRVLAAPVVSGCNVPAFANSQMDGYAARAQDLVASQTYAVSQRIAAGQTPMPLEAGSLARIFTGAPMPDGADTVVMQEDTELVDLAQASRAGSVGGSSGGLPWVRVLRVSAPGQFVRRPAADLRMGQTVLAAGHRLRAADLGLLSSIGCTEITVLRRLRAAVFSSGDELVAPGQPLLPGKIYDSNRPMMMALLRGLGVQVTDMGCLPDRLDATRAALAAAAERHDLLMTSGGVSVGEEDHMKAAVQAEGILDLWKIAIKPGKPFAHGRIGQAAFVGLPGNPVSSWVTFAMLVQPFIRRLSGETRTEPQRCLLPAGFDWPKPDKREEFLRGGVNEAGQVVLHDRQDSHILSSVCESQGLVRIPPGEAVAAGQAVWFYPFQGLVS
ncbi:MAG: gephyrin-like molybdotransferase Glp [Burkholderiaceae bacterium]